MPEIDSKPSTSSLAVAADPLQQTIECTDSLPIQFLIRLNIIAPSSLQLLYGSPSSALFLYRILPSLCQQWIARVAFLPATPIAYKTFGLWMKSDDAKSTNALRKSIRLLIAVGVFREDSDDSSVSLTDNFKHSIRKGFLNGVHAAAKFEPMSNVGDRKSFRDIEKKANERWECLLQYLALPSDHTKGMIGVEMRQMLDHAGLTHNSSGAEVEITSAGFQFLLLDRTKQIWRYMIHYFDYQIEQKHDIVPLLDLLFRLSFAASSVPYILDASWSDEVHTFVQHLRELGLVFMRKRKDGYFFATPLVEHLRSSMEDDDESGSNKDSDKGFVIVETNYRVYAYTESSLKLAILSTFCEMTYRFADMSVGILTRESVRRALTVGITAEQIISYLRSHTHEQIRDSGHSFPITVADQIRLWEHERNRLTFYDASLYSTFESEEDYASLRDFTQTERILLWKSDTAKLVVADESGHAKVKQWWRMNKKT